MTRSSERGSALVISVLVMAIMTLLGISFLMMAETENQIAENEKLSAQALYVGEASVRQVKRWFDRPRSSDFLSWNLDFPAVAIVDRTLRMVDDDGDPSTAAHAQDGVTWPRYKQGVDITGPGGVPDAIDDLFDQPYRSALTDTLLGTEDGPDMRIDAGFSAAAATFLDDLSEDLVANFPDRDKGVTAKISRIDIYQPPHVNVAGTWTRYGMATIATTVQIVKPGRGGAERVIAERTVRAVLNQMPYPGPYGPLHSCDSMDFNGDFTVHWGVASAVSDADLTNNHQKLAASWPRDVPPTPKIDLLWGWNDSVAFNNLYNALDATNEEIEDPWFRYMAGGKVADVAAWGGNPALPNPFAFTWTDPDPLADGDWPNHENGGQDGSHTNIMQDQPTVTCPAFDYEIWKQVATSGGSDVHYYVWSSGTSFKENGVGTARTFRDITDDPARSGALYFFDTKNGVKPIDTDSDGDFDNLTPPIVIQGGTWGATGFFFINAETFQTKGVGGRATEFAAPGEPYADADQDGVFDAGEDYVNMQYPTALGDPFLVDSTDNLQNDGTFIGPVMRNSRGPSFNGTSNMWGILFNSGQFEATGNGLYYGSVISESGIGESSPAAGTPDFYWDESILGSWPPSNWNMPRTAITRWEVDLRE